MKRICVVSGGRADFGILEPLIYALQSDDFFDLTVMTTGEHDLLSIVDICEPSMTELWSHEIKLKHLEILTASRSPAGVAKAMGLGLISFAEFFKSSAIDVVVLLGDRYEILSVAIAASLSGVPIAHLHGGEVTYGSLDDSFRHAITKLSTLHLVSTEIYANRVKQLGESDGSVFVVGGLGCERVEKMIPYGRAEVLSQLGLPDFKSGVLVTYHPSMKDLNSSLAEFDNLLSALSDEDFDCIIFTSPNMDFGGDLIMDRINDFVARAPFQRFFFRALGTEWYISLLTHIGLIIGNSSSAVLEAPSCKTRIVNVGTRQEGRVFAGSILSTPGDKKSIKNALQKISSEEYLKLVDAASNPYFKNGTCKNILHILKSFNFELALSKRFVDLGGNFAQS